MDWHIITSSKGGVGKTLISLMLTAYHAVDNHVLILDLNGMNADLSRLLASDLFKSGKAEEHLADYLFLDLGEKLGKFHFERVPDNEYIRLSYVNSWPENAFKTFGPETFCELLVTLQEKIKNEISNRFGYTITTVIIDTSYHFCNIFPTEAKVYDEDKPPFKFKYFFRDENIFIWFIWVYRQFADLIEVAEEPNNPHYVAVTDILEIVPTLEKKLKNDKLGNPFVHVFSPLFVGQMLAEKGPNWKDFFKKLLTPIRGTENIAVKPLQKLFSSLDKGNRKEASGFRDFLKQLEQARKQVPSTKKTEDTNSYFLNVLDTYVSLEGDWCSKNVVPMYIYQKNLLGYTEAEYEGLLLDQIYDKEIYRDNFERAYGALLETKK